MSMIDIISLKTGEKHSISKGESLAVGRELKEGSRTILLEQQGGSRDHSLIFWESEDLLLIDQGSKNGTSVNGEPLTAQEEYKLQDRDRLSFAGEDFMVSFTEEEKQVMNLGSLTGEIEEAGGRRRFSIMLEDNNIYGYEKEILSAGQIESALQAAFVTLEGKDKVYYDFTGYCQLEEYLHRVRTSCNRQGEEREQLDLVLDVLLNILHAIKNCEEHLLLPERIPMGMEAIFVHMGTKAVSFAFIPALAGGLSPQERLVNLLNQMAALYDDVEAKGYLESIREKIKRKNPGIDGIITIVATLQREKSFIHWTRQGLRKADPQEPEKKEEEGTEGNKDAQRGLQLPAWWKHKKGRMVMLQITVAAGLVAVYLLKVLEGLDFIGFLSIAAGIDIWLIKGLKEGQASDEKV